MSVARARAATAAESRAARLTRGTKRSMALAVRSACALYSRIFSASIACPCRCVCGSHGAVTAMPYTLMSASSRRIVASPASVPIVAWITRALG